MPLPLKLDKRTYKLESCVRLHSVDAFVSMVYLYDDQTMKVEFNCEDVIRRALEKYGA